MKFDAQKILWLSFLLVAGIILTLVISGCVSMPPPVVDSVEELYKGSILIDGDYVELVIKCYVGDERNNKLRLVEKHLKLFRELNEYCQEHKDD